MIILFFLLLLYLILLFRYNGCKEELYMKLKVNQEACIGCGACVATAEDLFEINDEGLSQAKVEEVPKDYEEEAQEAADSCPVNAIEVE